MSERIQRTNPGITQTATGVEIAVRVIPRARKSEIAGTRGDAVLVRLAAAPVDGAANAALVDLLARRFAVPISAIRIISGDRSRQKRIGIVGITVEQVESCLKR